MNQRNGLYRASVVAETVNPGLVKAGQCNLGKGGYDIVPPSLIPTCAGDLSLHDTSRASGTGLPTTPTDEPDPHGLPIKERRPIPDSSSSFSCIHAALRGEDGADG